MRIRFAAAVTLLVMVLSGTIARGADQDSLLSENPEPVKVQKSWFENIQLRGYAQLRYNGLLESNPNLKCDQCDKSWE